MIGTALATTMFAAGCNAALTGGAASPAAATKSTDGSVDGYGGANGEAADAQSLGANTTEALAVTSVGDLSDVVTDGEGFALYRFDNDTNQPPTSNCYDDCAEAWPPVLIEGEPSELSVEGIDPAKLGVLKRADGTRQLTLNNWPMYHYAQDTAPGQAAGEGVGGIWWAIGSTGVRAKDAAPAAPAETTSTLIKVMDVAPYGRVLTDAEGFTLYRFDNDTNRPPTSTCYDGCAETWPPVLAEGDVVVDGVDESLVGTVERADGTTQVTVAGWPLYYYALDTAPCETNGHGVGEVWFIAAENGSKATA